ncbi:MAG: hypothetical protein KDD58_04260 [Bdellovibrionales bacterium]|nr:hypothetical protein [Bdellovibrionales bacterium]
MSYYFFIFLITLLPSISYSTNNPDFRSLDCVSILEFSSASRQLRVSKLTDKNHPVFKDEIQGEVIEEFETIRLFHKEGRIPNDSFHPYAKTTSARLLLLHGLSTNISDSSTLRGPLINFVRTQFRERSKNKTKKEPVINVLLENQDYIRFGAEAIDLPFHGYGPNNKKYWQTKQAAIWLGNYIINMKKEAPELPIFIISRSTSSVLASLSLQNEEIRQSISGLIFVSPSWPNEPEIIQYGVSDLMSIASQKNGLFLNDIGMAWAINLLHSESWNQFNFYNIPTLILIGKDDPQVHESERLHFQNLASQHSNIHFKEIEDGKHDLLGIQNSNNKDRRASINTYLSIYSFASDVLNL